MVTHRRARKATTRALMLWVSAASGLLGLLALLLASEDLAWRAGAVLALGLAAWAGLVVHPKKHHATRAWRFARAVWPSLALLWLGWAVVRLARPLDATAYPLLYLLLTFLMGTQSRVGGLTLLGAALATEWAMHLLGRGAGLDPHLGASQVLLHSALLAASAGLSLWVSRAPKPLPPSSEAAHASHKPTEPEVQALQPPAAALDAALAAHVRLLHASLGCHTVALLWLDEDGERLLRRAAHTEGGALASVIQPGEGAVAGILRRGTSLASEPRPGYQGLSYYREPQTPPVRAFLGVPLLPLRAPRAEGDTAPPQVLGVLCLDRTQVGQPFTAQEIAGVEQSAQALMRQIEAAQAMTNIAAERDKLDFVQRASRELARALTPEEVFRAALPSVWELCDGDLAALVLYHREGERFEVAWCATHPPRPHARHTRAAPQDPPWEARAGKLLGEAFGDNNGLVAMSLSLNQRMPRKHAYQPGVNVIFSPKLDGALGKAQSVLVLPLMSQEEPIGALVLAGDRAALFSEETQNQLETLACQMAVSMANARMYARMEEMATTDGLTGLTNRRHFQTRFEEVRARSERLKVPFTMILTDIDHFKRINDTHGHPTGDEVLRQVAKTFRAVLRQTDVVARYGGEEFVVLLESTDLQGAHQLAERLRREVARLVFQGAQQTFSITMSFGLAEHRVDAQEAAELLEHADQALYYAKSHGRNQVRAWREVRALPDFGAKHPKAEPPKAEPQKRAAEALPRKAEPRWALDKGHEGGAGW